jgi:hypothetical protein
LNLLYGPRFAPTQNPQLILVLDVQLSMKAMVAYLVSDREVITALVILNSGIDQNNVRPEINASDDVCFMIREVELISQMKLGDSFYWNG